VVHGYIFSAELRYSSPGLSSINSTEMESFLPLRRRFAYF